MNNTHKILTAIALSLTMSTLASAQIAATAVRPTLITSVPFTITAPGTYVLASDLVESAPQDASPLARPLREKSS